MNNKNELLLRPEAKSDYRTVEELTRDAFWDVFQPGCDEHLVLHLLRNHPDFIPALSFVAEQNSEIVGHVAYSHAAIVQADGTRLPVVTPGPLSVRPDCKKTGVGTALMRHTLARAREMRAVGVVLCGWPDYYPRFGFRPAGDFGITDRDGHSPVHLQALPLAADTLPAGVFAESEVFFAVTPARLDAFDASFPPREKHRRPGQLF